MKKVFWLLISIIFLSFFWGADFIFAKINQPDINLEQKNLAIQPSVEINLFYSAICPHCKQEREFLKELETEYPQLRVKDYEVFYNSNNKKILNEFYEKYQVPEKDRGWVPITFTGKKYFIGFNNQIGNEIETCIKECVAGTAAVAPQKIKIPVLGEINISKISLPSLTILLGTLDGFNPCAMWVLLVLISLLLASKSRKKIALVGGIFVFAEGFLYFLIMAAWLNVFLALSYISLIRILIGIFGIGFGIWRIRDFIYWKPGVCKVTETTKSQEKILDKINKVLKPSTVPATIFGVIVLAFGVNLIEFFCSAGFPTMYTKILALQNLSQFKYYFYLIFYNLFYMLDDFVVFGVALFTLSRFGFSEKYNRYSTLIAGILILILGILLILRPEYLMFG